MTFDSENRKFRFSTKYEIYSTDDIEIMSYEFKEEEENNIRYITHEDYQWARLGRVSGNGSNTLVAVIRDAGTSMFQDDLGYFENREYGKISTGAIIDYNVNFRKRRHDFILTFKMKNQNHPNLKLRLNDQPIYENTPYRSQVIDRYIDSLAELAEKLSK